MQKIKVVVESVAGYCAAGCKPGDVFIYHGSAITVENAATPLCTFALSAITPYLSAAWRATDGDWAAAVQTLQCPDIKNKVVFRLDRVE